MELLNKTIVITGGTSGIGYQLVKLLYDENQLVVISRPSSRLEGLKTFFPRVAVYSADLSNPGEYETVADRIIKDYGQVDVLINNAAIQNVPSYLDDEFNYDGIQSEINLNFTAICALSYLLLPALLSDGRETVIANVNSGLALAPKTSSAVYCATKAAMNVFSQSLRYQLESSNVSVVQAFLPLVDTGMTKGRGKGKITAEDAADQILDGIEKGAAVTDVGKVKLLRLLLRVVPGIAYRIMKGH